MSDLRNGPFPNGGWQFYQAQTRWSNPLPLARTFHATVDAIIQHRLQNIAIAKKYGLATDWPTVANELENYTRHRLNIPEDSPPKPSPTQRLAQPGVVGEDSFFESATRRLKATSTGIKVYLETFGETCRPVEQAEAERRAVICAVCPNNNRGDWRSFFTEAAARSIMSVFEILMKLDLKTAKDPMLGICSACLCPLRQKVHVKLEHILKHTDEETKERLRQAPNCWIVK